MKAEAERRARELADIAERLRGVSALGLRFSTDRYDRERYQAIQAVAIELLGLATGSDLVEIEALRTSMLAHITPFVGVDAAVMDEDQRVLLIRRADNELWAMPGGMSDVGETPSQTACRETREETGVAVEAVALVGIFDSRVSNTPGAFHLYHAVFICSPSGQVGPASHEHEVLEQAWFAQGDLPTDMDPGHAYRLPVALRVARGERGAYFD